MKCEERARRKTGRLSKTEEGLYQSLYYKVIHLVLQKISYTLKDLKF